MTKNVYLEALQPSQRKPILGREEEMVQNHAGGFTFSVNEFDQFKRWLLLGSTICTMYRSADALTAENVTNVVKMIKNGSAKEMLDYAVEVSTHGRVVKLDQTFLLLALVYAHGSDKDKHYAEQVFAKLIRTPYQLIVFHLKADNPELQKFYEWYYGYFAEGNKELLPPNELAKKFIKIQHAQSAEEIIPLLDKDTPWEFLPNWAMNDKKVWEALLPHMPYTALVRNLPKLSAMNIKIDAQRIIDDLDPKVHPFTLFMALASYSGGKNRNLVWEVQEDVLKALEFAARKAFKNVPPINKRAVVAVDVSGSMWWNELPSLGNMYPGEAAVVMAQVVMSQFEAFHIIAFADEMQPLPITPETSFFELEEVCSKVNWGRTDCAQPMLWAKEKGIKTDLFIVLTDSVTWAWSIHPTEALQQYRETTGINAGLIVCAMEPTRFSIADPQDPRQVDICGADASLPKIVETLATEIL